MSERELADEELWLLVDMVREAGLPPRSLSELLDTVVRVHGGSQEQATADVDLAKYLTSVSIEQYDLDETSVEVLLEWEQRTDRLEER